MFQSHCYHSCHQNFTVCTQRAVLAKMRADTSLELQGHRNQQLWDITFFFLKQANKWTKQNNTTNHTTKHWRITQHSYSYGTDNCCQLTSGPDPSSDLIAALASSFSSYVLISGPNPKSKATISRISTLFTGSTIGRGICTQPAPEGAQTRGISLLEAGLRSDSQAQASMSNWEAEGHQVWHSTSVNALGLETDTSVQLSYGREHRTALCQPVTLSAWLFCGCLHTEIIQGMVLPPFPSCTGACLATQCSRLGS